MRPPDIASRYFLTRPPSRPVARPPATRLGEALLDGFITRGDYAETIARCRSCDRPAICARWIEALLPEGDDAPSPAPCANAALFAELGRL